MFGRRGRRRRRAAVAVVGPAGAAAEAVSPAPPLFPGALAAEDEQRDDDEDDGEQESDGHHEGDQILRPEPFFDDVLESEKRFDLGTIFFIFFAKPVPNVINVFLSEVPAVRMREQMFTFFVYFTL